MIINRFVSYALQKALKYILQYFNPDFHNFNKLENWCRHAPYPILEGKRLIILIYQILIELTWQLFYLVQKSESSVKANEVILIQVALSNMVTSSHIIQLRTCTYRLKLIPESRANKMLYPPPIVSRSV